MKNSSAFALTSILLVAIAAGVFTAVGTPEQRQKAEANALLIAPTATAMAVRSQVVAPAQAKADAESIIANNQLRIDQDKAIQEQEHEIALSKIHVEATLAAGTAKAQADMAIGEAQAANRAKIAKIESDAFGTQMQAVGQALMWLAVVLAAGGVSLGVARWAGNRAKVVPLRNGEELVFMGGQLVYQPSRSLGPITNTSVLPEPVRAKILLKAADSVADGSMTVADFQALRVSLDDTYALPLPADAQTMLSVTTSAQLTGAMIATHNTAGLNSTVANVSKLASAAPRAQIAPPEIIESNDDVVYARLLEVTRS